MKAVLLINNHLIAADVRCAYNGHPLKLVVDILLEVLMVIQVFPQVEFRIDKQVMWFLAEIGEIVFHEFINRAVECILIHRSDDLFVKLPGLKSMPTVCYRLFPGGERHQMGSLRHKLRKIIPSPFL
jgi:hypothetical protein